jgi:hypothetical protein
MTSPSKSIIYSQSNFIIPYNLTLSNIYNQSSVQVPPVTACVISMRTFTILVSLHSLISNFFSAVQNKFLTVNMKGRYAQMMRTFDIKKQHSVTTEPSLFPRRRAHCLRAFDLLRRSSVGKIFRPLQLKGRVWTAVLAITASS